MAKNTDTVSVKEWVESAPLARVKRKELVPMFDACDLATRHEVLVIVTRALREYAWYRRLWRWLKAKALPKHSLDDLKKLRPDALEVVQQQLDAAREAQKERADG